MMFYEKATVRTTRKITGSSRALFCDSIQSVALLMKTAGVGSVEVDLMKIKDIFLQLAQRRTSGTMEMDGVRFGFRKCILQMTNLESIS